MIIYRFILLFFTVICTQTFSFGKINPVVRQELNSNYQLTNNKNEAVFYRLVTYKDFKKVKIISIKIFDRATNTLLLMGENLKSDSVFKSGIWHQYYNQKIYITSKYVNGKIEGTSFHYYNKDSISEKTNYKNGLKDGKYYSYFPNGKIQNETTYIKDKINGTWVEYYENPYRVRFISTYLKDSLLSEIYYDQNGNSYSTKNLIDSDISKQDGQKSEYYPDCKIKKQYFFKNNSLNGDYITYYQNGNILSKSTYIDGDINGWSYEYNINGDLTSKKLFKYDNVVCNILFHNNKKLAYIDNIKDTLWYSNGKIAEIDEYDGGINRCKIFDSDGNQISLCSNDPLLSYRAKSDDDCSFGIMNQDNWIVKPAYSMLDDIYNNKIICSIKNNEGLIDTLGNVIIPLKANSQITYPYKFNTYIIPHKINHRFYNQFDGYYGFSKKAKKGLLHINKGIILPDEYDFIEIQPNRKIVAIKNRIISIIDLDNTYNVKSFNFHGSIDYFLRIIKQKHCEIIPEETGFQFPQFPDCYKFLSYKKLNLSFFPTDLFTISKEPFDKLGKKSAQVGVIDINGNIIVPPKYNSISKYITNDYIWAKMDTTVHIFDFKGNLVNKIKGKILDNYNNVEIFIDKINYYVQSLNQNGKKSLYNYRGDLVCKDFDNIYKIDTILNEYQVIDNKKFKLCKNSNQIIISNADVITKIENDYIASVNNQYGLVDENGKILIPHQYQYIVYHPFYYNQTPTYFSKENNKWLVLNRNGKKLSEESYEYLSTNFSIANELRVFNRNPNDINSQFEERDDNNRLNIFTRIENVKQQGLFKNDGSWYIKPNYQVVNINMVNGYKFLYFHNDPNGECALINNDGSNKVILPQIKSARQLDYNNIALELYNGNSYLIDTLGKPVSAQIPGLILEADPYFVYSASIYSKVGVYQRSGKTVIDTVNYYVSKYNSVSQSFWGASDKYANYLSYPNWVLYSKEGKQLNTMLSCVPVMISGDEFSFPTRDKKNEEKFAYMSKSGRLLLEPKYLNIEKFEDFYWVKKVFNPDDYNKFIQIDFKGKPLNKHEYTDYSYIGNGTSIAYQKHMPNLVNKKGEVMCAAIGKNYSLTRDKILEHLKMYYSNYMHKFDYFDVNKIFNYPSEKTNKKLDDHVVNKILPYIFDKDDKWPTNYNVEYGRDQYENLKRLNVVFCDTLFDINETDKRLFSLNQYNNRRKEFSVFHYSKSVMSINYKDYNEFVISNADQNIYLNYLIIKDTLKPIKLYDILHLTETDKKTLFPIIFSKLQKNAKSVCYEGTNEPFHQYAITDSGIYFFASQHLSFDDNLSDEHKLVNTFLDYNYLDKYIKNEMLLSFITNKPPKPKKKKKKQTIISKS